METKICSKCGIKKPNDDDHFPKDHGKLSPRCKTCRSEYYKKWRSNNIDKCKIYNKEYRKNNLEKLNNYNKKNKEKKSKYNTTYWNDNKEKVRVRRKKNKKRENELRNIRRNEKRQNDPLFKIQEGIRGKLKKHFKNNGYIKKSKTQEILGCSFEKFKIHLESKFEPWMTWENKGLYNGEFNYGWDIDHIIPLVTAETEEELMKLNHYTNLQPLCSKINRDIKKDNTDY